MNTHRFFVSAYYRFRDASVRILGYDAVTRRRLGRRDEWKRLGSESCGWLTPQVWEVPEPTCYCVGAGEDISFDLALAKEYGAVVLILDPTPRSAELVQRTLGSDYASVDFRPWALWVNDGDVWLYEPRDSSHVSHSIVNLQGTSGGFRAAARTLDSIAAEFGHASIDLLKMDIEGADYSVLEQILDTGVPVGIIEVEFDELSWPRRGAHGRIRRAVDRLEKQGYKLRRVDSGNNYTFRHERYTAAGWTRERNNST